MDYQAIARKWRPHRFEDLVGQNHVVQTLRNAIQFQRVAHAYLFSGARGVGKTSVARIFAKALRCPNTKEGTPCNHCGECEAISTSRSMDVVEIDGASNNGVEAIREIRENVSYGASTGKYKIYIIDEVHMLSTSAFNALLKTLEEPPPHVLFIFATTESQKIPLTILSRCQRFEFRRLSNQQIVERLQKILKEEKAEISEEGLRIIASHSDGALRDAQSLLDQVLSYFGGVKDKKLSLDETKVVEALGVSRSDAVRALLTMIAENDTKGILEVINHAYEGGVDLKHFASRTLEELRLAFLLCLARENKDTLTADDLDISTGQLEELSAIVEKVSLLQIERMSQIMAKTIQQITWSSLPRYVLEMAAIRMARLEALPQIETTLREGATPRPSAPVYSTPATKTAPPAPVPRLSTPMARPRMPDATSWKGFIDMVMRKRPLLGALLSHANFKVENKEKDKKVHLAFPEESFYEKQAHAVRRDIEKLVKEFFGPETSIALSNSMDDTNDSLEKLKEAEHASLKKQAMEHPTVQQMKQALGAEIVDVTVSEQ